MLTAPSPALFVSIDQPVSDVGANRTQYKWPPLPQDATVSFHLGPDQSLYGAAGQGGGVVSFGVLIEYLEE